jgi:uncharacterized protein (DUF302 family)
MISKTYDGSGCQHIPLKTLTKVSKYCQHAETSQNQLKKAIKKLGVFDAGNPDQKGENP